MPTAIALIPTRLTTTALGLPSLVGDRLAGQAVLEHTVARVARVEQVQKIVLLHASQDDPAGLLSKKDYGKPVETFADPDNLQDAYLRKRVAARKWSLSAWRGGLGGATCYDELLPAGAMQRAMEHYKADAALLVGADWLLVDPEYCRRVLGLHLAHPQDMQMTFTQAPPGLAGIALGHELIGQLVENKVGFGQLLTYNPAKPQADPIGRDVCCQVPASVRSCRQRLIYDTPASAALIRWVADRLGDRLAQADAAEVTDAVAKLDDQTAGSFAKLPQMISLELTPQRRVTGPITPQHYAKLDRQPMPLDMAKRIVAQMGQDKDTVLTLGGLGDALLYEHWEEVVVAARDAGVLGIAVETDLLVEQSVVERLLELPIDVVSVRLNADTAATYEKVMAPDDTFDDGFAGLVKKLEWLFNTRNRRTRDLLAGANGDSVAHDAGLPWVVLRLVKTKDTLADMETFYDRWVYYAGHAVIEPFTAGCGLAPDLSPVRMAPPKRTPCRQLMGRMTILSDGRVAQCDQDWLGAAVGGDATATPLADIWQSMQATRRAHEQGQWDQLELCRKCHEWHRP